jgi:hypothetical protein
MITKFKIGDIVRCKIIASEPIRRTAMGDELKEIYGYGWKKNKTFKIIKVGNVDNLEGSKKEPIYWYDDLDGRYGVYEEALELVEKLKSEVYGIVKFLESINAKV